MTKEQFLAISVPFGLMGTVKGKENVSGSLIYTLHACFHKTSVCEVVGSSTFYTDKFKPILHPLTDLTKEIEHNGEKFIPVLKLLEANSFDINENPLELIEKYKGIYFDIDLLFLSDALLLIEYHFDICSLTEQGEAIDVNTLDKNPYK